MVRKWLLVQGWRRKYRAIFLVTLFIGSAIFIIRYLRVYGPIPSSISWPENEDQLLFFAEVATSPLTSKKGAYILDLDNNRLTNWKPFGSSFRYYYWQSWAIQKEQFLLSGFNNSGDGLFLIDKFGVIVEEIKSLELRDNRFLTISPNAESIVVINRGDFYVQNLVENTQQNLQEEAWYKKAPMPVTVPLQLNKRFLQV